MNAKPAPKAPADRAKILKAATSLGALGAGSQNAPHILTMLCSAETSAGDVAFLISKEPTLYARVLRVANSAYYGQSRMVTSIERALGVLGLDAVRGIAAAACLDRSMARGTSNRQIDMQALILHSQATAAASEALAKIARPLLSSDAFIAGLLHNLGTTLQSHIDSTSVGSILERRRQGDQGNIRELESRYGVVGHEECGAVLFEEWRLPESLIAATRYHHDPMATPERHRELSALVNLGSDLALSGGNTFALEPAATLRSEPAVACLGLLSEQLDDVAAQLPERLAALRTMFET